MATDEDAGQRIKRSAARTVTNGLFLLISFGIIGGWVTTGFYVLELGEAAIIMQLGKFQRVERREGLRWHWPEPLESDIAVNVTEIRSVSFGMLDGSKPGMGDDGERVGTEGSYERFIQTADNNIVSVSYDLQYSVNNPYSFAFGMVEPDQILHDATEAAVREIIGARGIDNVLIYEKRQIELEAGAILREILSTYASLIIDRDDQASEPVDPEHDPNSPFNIEKISLQTVHPPSQVRGAFEDVKAAQQDEDRAMSRAKGDAQEIIEQSRGQASELHEGSQAYKQARVLESRGEATRFTALLAEYKRAPVVTRQRLYLETMEDVIGRANKMVVDAGAASVIPIFGDRPRPAVAVSAPPPAEDGQ